MMGKATDVDEPLRAVIYARKSYKRDGDEESESIRSQVEECTKRADRENWVLADEPLTDDGRSGFTGDERPGFEKLLRVLMAPEKQVDVVLVRSVNRLSRNSLDSSSIKFALQHHGTKIQALDGGLTDLDDPMADAMFSILQVFATLESKQKSATLKFSYATMRDEGVLRSSHKSYGWIYSPGKDGIKSNMTADPEERFWIQRASEYVVAHDDSNIYRLLKFANDERVQKRRPKLKPVRAKVWSYATLRNLLLRPANAGFVSVPMPRKPKNRDLQGNIIEETAEQMRARRDLQFAYHPDKRGQWDRLVSDELYLQVRQRLLRSVDTPARGPKQKALLAGIAVCDACGELITTSKTRGVDYYRCRQTALSQNYPNRDTTIKHHSQPRAAVDEAVRNEVVLAYLWGPNNLLQSDEEARELAPLYEELQAKEGERRRILTMGEQGFYDSHAEMEQSLSRVQSERTRLRGLIEEAQASNANRLTVADLKQGMYRQEGAKTYSTLLDDGSTFDYAETKAELLRRFEAHTAESQRVIVRALLAVRLTSRNDDGTRWKIEHRRVTGLNVESEAERLSWHEE